MSEEQVNEILKAVGWNPNKEPSKTQIWMVQHPLATVGIAVGGIALVGGLIGFAIGRATA